MGWFRFKTLKKQQSYGSGAVSGAIPPVMLGTAMKILIVSDTHCRQDNYKKAIAKTGSMDLLIHCGDTEGEEEMLSSLAPCPAIIVMGNNDFFSDLPREREFMLGRYKVWVTHGHNYYVSMGTDTIKQEAAERGVDIVIYGHTHKPVIDASGSVIALNPGSLTYPRQAGRKPSYMLMELDREGEAHFTIVYL